MSDYKKFDYIAFGLCLGALTTMGSTAITAWVFGSIKDTEWQRESLAHGHAEYVIRDGKPVWQWLPPAEKGQTK